MSKSILLQTVGTGRDAKLGDDHPGNPVWEAMAFVVQHRSPQILLQLCSSKTHKETLPKFEKSMQGKPMPQILDPVISADPEHVEELTLEYAQKIEQLQSDYPDHRIEVDYTSGTKAMSAAIVATAIAHKVPLLHYATGDRDEGGRVKNTTGVCTLKTETLVAERELNELGRLFNLGQFVAVKKQAELIEHVLEDGLLRSRAITLNFLAEIYDHWDRFDWAPAAQKLKDYDRVKWEPHLREAGWDLGKIGKQHKHLEHAKKNKDGTPPTDQRLIDLYANAQRCITTGRYDDAVSRLYRLVEYIGQAALHPEMPKTSKVSTETLKAHAPKQAEKLGRCAKSGTVKLGLSNNICVLNEMQKPIGIWLYSRYMDKKQKPYGPLASLLDKRNNSLLAHGTNPVKKEDAEKLSILVADALGEYCDTPNDACDSQRFKELCNIATFSQCPWVK